MEKEAGRVEAIWLKRGRGAPMDAVERAEMVAGEGLVGNADRGGRRQVTVIDAGVWEERVTRGLGSDLDPSARRANVLVRGVELAGSRGRVLRLGQCLIRIFNETKPCELMDEALPGLKAALYTDWGGGAFGEVAQGGVVRVGDIARWEDAPAEEEGRHHEGRR